MTRLYTHCHICGKKTWNDSPLLTEQGQSELWKEQGICKDCRKLGKTKRVFVRLYHRLIH